MSPVIARESCQGLIMKYNHAEGEYAQVFTNKYSYFYSHIIEIDIIDK
jgi:hypothetical protein